MKNLKKLFILLILFIPSIALADMGAPIIRPYEVVTVNVNGIDYYDHNGNVAGHLNKDETVYVEYEYENDISLAKKEGDSFKTLGNVKSLDGFVVVQDTVDPTTIQNDTSIIQYENELNALVYADSVDLQKGPASLYEKILSIKKGTTLKYKYAIDGGNNVTYIYTTYEGKSGWINILNKNVLIHNDVQYIFKNDVSTKCGTIPKNSITTPQYKSDGWSWSILVEYNNCKDLIEAPNNDIYILSNEYTEIRKLKTNKEINIYEYADDTSKIIGTAPISSEIIFITSSDSRDEKIVSYIEYNGIRGWIFDDTNEFEYISKVTDKKIEDTIKVAKNNDNSTSKTVEKEEIKKVSDNKISSRELVIICVSGAVILSLTAVVIVLLVNKKKTIKENK